MPSYGILQKPLKKYLQGPLSIRFVAACRLSARLKATKALKQILEGALRRLTKPYKMDLYGLNGSLEGLTKLWGLTESLIMFRIPL